VTQSITLSAGENSQLSFWTAFDIEDRWDGGVVEITTDDKQWDQVTLSPNYPDSFRDSADSCGYDQGTPSFTGTSLTWQQHTMDLSSYQGQDIKIRWNFSTDQNVNNEGWYLDDFSVTHTQIPSQCITLSDVIYQNGFE
jgi:bacillopeptidase F (M6 metalloprotease family)